MAALTVRNIEDDLIAAFSAALTGPRRTGAELVAALRRLGELGLELEPDRRSEPPRVEL